LYAVVLPYCYLTAGEPRRLAMINAQEIADKNWAQMTGTSVEGTDDDQSGTNSTASSLSSNGIHNETVSALSSSTATIPGVQSSSSSSPSSPDFEYDEDEDFFGTGSKSSTPGSSSAEGGATPAAPGGSSKSFLSGWFGPTKEQKQAQQEYEKFLKKFNGMTDDGEPMSLPPSYLPSAWACLALFSLLTAHVLFHLLCHWIVQFKAMALFSPSKTVDEKTVLLVTPPANRGKPLFVPTKRSALTKNLQIEFQRQTYIYTPASRLGDNSAVYKNGVLTLSASPVDLPLQHYWNARGHRSEGEVETVLEQWGRNHLAVQIPSFVELLQQQM